MLATYLNMITGQTDKLRFEQLYHSYRKQMLAVAYRILENPDDAEDAVQDALLGIVKSISSLRELEDTALRAYVLTAAKNAALKILYRNKKGTDTERILELDYKESESVFQTVLNTMAADLLLRAMRQLDPIYRDVLLLTYVQECDLQETAATLGRKEETVRKQLYRGRKLLIELCRKEGLNFGEK